MSVEKEVGAENLKSAHQECYSKLKQELVLGRIPFFLTGHFNANNKLQFLFVNYDYEQQVYHYKYQFVIGF